MIGDKKIKALEDLNTILKFVILELDENKRLREELKDMQEQRDNALKIAENAILELRGRE